MSKCLMNLRWSEWNLGWYLRILSTIKSWEKNSSMFPGTKKRDVNLDAKHATVIIRGFAIFIDKDCFVSWSYMRFTLVPFAGLVKLISVSSPLMLSNVVVRFRLKLFPFLQEVVCSAPLWVLLKEFRYVCTERLNLVALLFLSTVAMPGISSGAWVKR